MITVQCRYEPPHTHTYPDDWEFGGPAGTDPRSDSRWRGDTFLYYDENFNQIWLTQTPLCDDQAIDEFTKIAAISPAFKPMYLGVKRAGQRKVEMLPYKYNRQTDEVEDL